MGIRELALPGLGLASLRRREIATRAYGEFMPPTAILMPVAAGLPRSRCFAAAVLITLQPSESQPSISVPGETLPN